MKTFMFTKEQAEFIKNGTGITLPPNKDVILQREEAEAIVDYSFDIESDEASKIDDETNISSVGKLASSICDMLTV